jgi:hypothetical protein
LKSPAPLELLSVWFFLVPLSLVLASPPAFYRARLLAVYLPPSLPFQDEDKCGLECWRFARARKPTVPPRLDCWWWILTRILAVYWEGQHDWLGTLGRPHRSAFTAFELPVIGGILNFFSHRHLPLFLYEEDDEWE